jgi:hypothetical protein
MRITSSFTAFITYTSVFRPERRRRLLSSFNCTVKEITPFLDNGVTLLTVPSSFSLPILTIALPPAATRSPYVSAISPPTVPVKEGYDGACVKLTTCDTGSFGSMAKMPIAAGNLFIGKFDATQALKDAMKATQFGVPVSFKPTRFSGYYKYKRGDVFTNRQKKVVEGKKDYGTIYAVFYDNHDEEGNSVVLYGDNVQTSPQVVALAIVPDIDDTPEWTHFDIDFIYKKEVDAQKLKNMGYSMAIVSSSSVEGASFMGAIGSTLWVDKFRITCEKE